jgi:hypothetical protein
MGTAIEAGNRAQSGYAGILALKRSVFMLVVVEDKTGEICWRNARAKIKIRKQMGS